jgi:hypothetical protein
MTNGLIRREFLFKLISYTDLKIKEFVRIILVYKKKRDQFTHGKEHLFYSVVAHDLGTAELAKFNPAPTYPVAEKFFTLLLQNLETHSHKKPSNCVRIHFSYVLIIPVYNSEDSGLYSLPGRWLFWQTFFFVSVSRF